MKINPLPASALFFSVINSVAAVYTPAQQPAAAAPEVRQAIATLRAQPPHTRQAYIAERLGLLFCRNGESGYTHAAHMHTREYGRKIFSPLPHAQACFMTASGSVSEFAAAVSPHTEAPAAEPAVGSALVVLHGEDEAAVLSAFAEEVTQICLHTAANRLAALPADLRAAVLAELGGMVYRAGSAGGAKPILRYGQRLYRIGRELQRIDHFGSTLYYADSRGQVHDFGAAVQAAKESPEQRNNCELILLAAQYIGAEDVLALYAEETAAMRRYFRQLAPQAPAAK